MTRILVFAFILFLSCSKPPADLLLVNGKIWTGVKGETANALAIWKGRIIAIGTDAEIKDVIFEPITKVVDAKGQRIRVSRRAGR